MGVPEKKFIVEANGSGVCRIDYDNDGWPDIYFTNAPTIQMSLDGQTAMGALYRNNHDGSFSDVTQKAGITRACLAMGGAVGDYDNDGWQDLFVSDARFHRLFHNPGKAGGFFMDVTNEAGVGEVSGQYVGWGDGFFDFDNDGWKDIFIVNGGLSWLIPMESALLRNNGNRTFTDVSTQAGSFFEKRQVSRAAAFGDYDNDGYVDAFVTTLGGPGVLLHNTPPAGKRNHWLTVKLVGTGSNRDGYGASLEAVAGGLRQYVQAISESGYLSQSDPRPHFGLGQHSEVDQLIIRWPSGTVQTLEHVKADQILTVKEPAGPAPAASKSNGK